MIVGQREESIAGLNPMQRKKRANGGSAHRTPWHVTIGGSEKPMSEYNPDVINEEKRRYGIPHNYPQKGNGGKDATEQNNRHIMPDN